MTGDSKTREEKRDGDLVTGSYTVADPDGRIRRVTYTAGKYSYGVTLILIQLLFVLVANLIALYRFLCYLSNLPSYFCVHMFCLTLP